MNNIFPQNPLENEFENIILEPFRDMFPDAQISRGYYRNSISLVISAASEDAIQEIWSKRYEISSKAYKLGSVCNWISLCLVGRWFYPPWMPKTFARRP